MTLSDSKPRPVTHSKPREKLHPLSGAKFMLVAPITRQSRSVSD